MSIDIVEAIDVGSTVIVLAILLLGIYRAAEMRRAFVSAVYRSRATWSILLMLIIIILFLSNFIAFPSSGAMAVVGSLPFLALIFVLVAYADRSILVAIQTDFLHRNTLAWPRLRWPAAIALVGFVLALVVGGVILTPAEQSSFLGVLLNDLFFAFLAAILAYIAAALIVGARRSADRTLRRSILLLGLALFTLVLSIVVTSSLTSGTLPYAIVNQGTGVVGIYLIYRSVMSLSPVGHIEKDVGAAATSETAKSLLGLQPKSPGLALGFGSPPANDLTALPAR